MAAHYRNGGLPPWAAGGGNSVKAPLLSNDYNAGSGVTYPPTNSDPKAQYENPTQFGVYGNLPPSNTQTTTPYSNVTGMTGYTGASYHTATSIPPTPPAHPMSPQPQTLGRHSQYTSTTSSYEPYGAPNVYNPPQAVYSAPPNVYSAPPPNVYNAARDSYAPPQNAPGQYSAPTTPAPDMQSPHSAVPPYESPTKGPEYAYAAQPSGSHLPAYAGGGAFGASDYPKEKGWEYTSPPVGSPPKQ